MPNGIFYGDCAPFLKRRRPVTCQRVFAALPDKEELEYSLPSDDPSQPYRAATRSRFDTPEFYAANADILRRIKLFQTVSAAFADMRRHGPLDASASPPPSIPRAVVGTPLCYVLARV